MHNKYKKESARKQQKHLVLLVVFILFIFSYLMGQSLRKPDLPMATIMGLDENLVAITTEITECQISEVADTLETKTIVSPLTMESTIPETSPEELITFEYKTLSLPTEANGKFKSYMDYRKISNRTSGQYHMQQLAYTNSLGFRMLDGKCLVAVGTFYAKEVGKELRVTLENGHSFNVIVGDIKDDAHTDANNQYVPINGNIMEFIIDIDIIEPHILTLGSVSSLGFEGSIIKIEEVVKIEYK